MTTLTIEQHTALLVAFDALRDKHVAAAVRRDLQSTEYLNKQYNVIRDFIDHATIEVEDAPPLWRDSDRRGWMKDGAIRLELVDAPYITVEMSCGWSVLIDDDDETVAVSPERLPALIAMLTEVQRRIEAGEAK